MFEASVFETDPIHALFEVLDLAFIVKVVLSLAVLLFIYDAVCGEKEGGTLRLYASFPVSRSTFALAKLIGSILTVLVPFMFACLLVCGVLAFSPEIELQGRDWGRIVVLMGVFALYLAIFATFGLLVSALTHRRMTAFLGLLGLWTVWLFVVPNVAVDAARHLVPTQSIYDFQKQVLRLRWEALADVKAEIEDYQRQHYVNDWNALTKAQQQELQDAPYKIDLRHDADYYSRLKALQMTRRNQTRRQQDLAMILSAISPMGAADFISMDLARTGPVQQEQIEDALSRYLIYLSQYMQDKKRTYDIWGGADMADFVQFLYQDSETLERCLSRNTFSLLNLVLLAILGFAGAYVAILRYDVR